VQSEHTIIFLVSLRISRTFTCIILCSVSWCQTPPTSTATISGRRRHSGNRNLAARP
jgi:hypothetical protein